ncbi:MAG: flagellin [Planctomycetota bacterium]
MSRINTNVNSLVAQRVLSQNNASLNKSLERLSTGLKINSGADNPAGLIASENLRAEKTGITAALNNAERAGNIIATAEGGLAEVGNLLNELQGLVVETANSGGLSAEELEANQLQVDGILNTINRLAGSVNFQGQKLLDGTYGYETSGTNLSSVNNLRVNSARLPDGSTQAVTVQVTGSAQVASIATAAGATLSAAVTIEVAGNKGTEQLSFLSSAAISSVAAGINALKDVTGVEATVSGTSLRIDSTGFGSDQFVKVTAISGGGFNGGTGSDEGQDATVSVNGGEASVDGLSVKYRSSNLDVEFDLIEGANYNGSTVAKSFSVVAGGADFSLGSKVSETEKASIGINSVSTGSLGLDGSFLSSIASGGANSLTSGNFTTAQEALSESIKQVSQARGRLGSFQKFTIGSTVNQLGVAFENASAAESAIRDADFALETAELTRSQILAQASTTVLAQANQQPQRVLSLLG